MSDSFATPWAVDRQAPVPMGIPRQVYWSGLSFQGNLPGPGVKPVSSALGGFFFFFFFKTTEPPERSPSKFTHYGLKFKGVYKFRHFCNGMNGIGCN